MTVFSGVFLFSEFFFWLETRTMGLDFEKVCHLYCTPRKIELCSDKFSFVLNQTSLSPGITNFTEGLIVKC